ncbi:TPA: hypothetical protein NJY08_005001 [Salmonella enterica subsp. enterica serovar Typhi str. AG3]|nr:hypothetical protein [Salmonella enterica subsp. enterica serovar Typhi str. AG3]
MTSMTPTISNETIADQIRKILMENEDVKRAICSMEDGYLKFFVRDGNIQKLRYKQTQLESSKIDWDDMDEEDGIIKVEESLIPSTDYRRFAYLLSTLVLNVKPIEYGHLYFDFNFYKKENNDWQEEVKFRFEDEIHFKFNQNIN